MRTWLAVLGLALIANAQDSGKAPRKSLGREKPVCSRGAICFAGEVSEGQEFRHTLDATHELVLSPGSAGWTITIVPKQPEGNCVEFASVVTPPYRSHRDLDINTSYGWTAEEEVSKSPREFSFVTNCADLGLEFER